jgi:hypothetical protein
VDDAPGRDDVVIVGWHPRWLALPSGVFGGAMPGSLGRELLGLALFFVPVAGLRLRRYPINHVAMRIQASDPESTRRSG